MSTVPDFKKPEIIYTNKHKVQCNGGGGALGHPVTYYVIGDARFVDCTYCDRRFIFKNESTSPEY